MIEGDRIMGDPDACGVCGRSGGHAGWCTDVRAALRAGTLFPPEPRRWHRVPTEPDGRSLGDILDELGD